MYAYYFLCVAAAGHLVNHFVGVDAAPTSEKPSPLELSGKAKPVLPQLQTSGADINDGILAPYLLNAETLKLLHQLTESFPSSEEDEIVPKDNEADDPPPITLLSDLRDVAADHDTAGHSTRLMQRVDSMSSELDTRPDIFEDTDGPSFVVLNMCAQYEEQYVNLNYLAPWKGVAEQLLQPQLTKIVAEYFSNIIVQVNRFKYGQDLPYAFPSFAYGPLGQSISLESIEAAMKSIEYIFFVYWDASRGDFRFVFGHSPSGSKNIDCSVISSALDITGHMVQMYSVPYVLSAKLMEQTITTAFKEHSNYERTQAFFTDKWQDYTLQAEKAYSLHTAM
ncbi:hypothetical protein H4R35_001480 [Dimargaris xerosporica]|nr:hypothetical protein H4R35_001480 [Dimargaris xerosporica]